MELNLLRKMFAFEWRNISIGKFNWFCLGLFTSPDGLVCLFLHTSHPVVPPAPSSTIVLLLMNPVHFNRDSIFSVFFWFIRTLLTSTLSHMLDRPDINTRHSPSYGITHKTALCARYFHDIPLYKQFQH